MNSESAEVLALHALAHVVGDEKALRTLLTQTGLSGTDIRAAAESREFLAGVLDFLTRHEEFLVTFCEAEDVRPESVARAHLILADDSGDSV